jgi:N-acetylmuramoyl-L-alanine amidase
MRIAPLARLLRPALLGVLALVLGAAAPAVRAEADILRVSFTPRADGRGHVVRLHTEGRVGAYSLDRPSADVLQLTIYHARVSPHLQRDDVRGPVRTYRVEPEGDRVVLTLSLGGAQVYPQAYPDRTTDDLLGALNAAPPAPVAAPLASAGTPAGSVAGAAGAAAAGAAHWRLDCVVIDAGHGGHDVGATAHGVREKDVTLGIARRLGRLVEERLGVRVVYTRADDRFIELHERGRVANASCGKLFVSIHANAGGGAARGTETYFLAPHRSESAREVMARENDVVRLESDSALYADFDAEGGIVRALAMGAYQEDSQELAGLIEREFRGGAGRHSRGVKQAGFLVLWRASMPAVLVETGFVTNEDEARYLASAAGQDELAGAVFRAVRAFKERYERGLRLAAAD